ncbi:MAG: hypothetical protein K0R44_3149, partial [Thermomicrobiales bacterium]|nr:hypothetical protein [Thermomicrobiales bacterium]
SASIFRATVPLREGALGGPAGVSLDR